MMDNGFLTTRAILLRCDPKVLRLGLINFLKELEQQWEDAIEEHDEQGCWGEDCDYEPPGLNAWQIADSIFQFSVFGERRVALDGDSVIDSGLTEVEELSEEEIQQEVQKFIDDLGTDEEENE